MTGPCGTLLRHLRRTLGAQAFAGLPDGHLLRLFVAGGGEAECAFEMLVRRHGPMVLRICRAAARDCHDAEDAFQATFLILVRRAGALTFSDSLGPWLFGVARRVCARAQADAARRKAREQAAAVLVQSSENRDDEAVATILDEVGRLPAAFRAAVVLCDLEGLTYQQAAERLGWTQDTVRGRLARARQRLRQRLTRLGLGPAAGAVLPAELPRALVAATTRAAVVFAGQNAGTVPATILLLVNGGLQTMLMTKFKSAVLTLLAAGLLAAGAVGLSAQAPTQKARGGPRGGAPKTEVEEGWKVRVDLADQIIELALQTKQQVQANKTAEALDSLSQVETLAREWTAQLRREQVRDTLELRQQRTTIRGKALELGFREGFAKVPSTPAADMESRLRDVEQKLDRILKAFENTPTQRGGPRGGPRGRRGGDGGGDGAQGGGDGARRGGGGDAGDAGGGARRGNRRGGDGGDGGAGGGTGGTGGAGSGGSGGGGAGGGAGGDGGGGVPDAK